MRKFLLLALSLYSLRGFAQENGFYREKYRPQYHFTPAIHWMNDPNGLVYYQGEYHLFYQFNPFGNRWGHMSWGHAISHDLLHWQHLPVALPEEKDTMIFSGTCVPDLNNSSGFATQPGQVPLVAIFTGHIENVSQSQHLAYSLDKGRTWTKYHQNPVLDIASKEFRDPQVFWYAPGKKWVMTLVLAAEKKIRFYSSVNLKHWDRMSDFGPAGDTSGVWECPDLFQVPVEGDPLNKKWVLMHSPSPYMQYFVGSFDGTTFANENPGSAIFRPDYGPDYYAAITYKNLSPTIAPVSIGWINNWNYANDLPTTPWKGAMSLPRQLSLKKINGEWILVQQPIDAVNSLREQSLLFWNNQSFSGTKKLPVHSLQTEIDLTLDPGRNNYCGIRIAAGAGHEVEIGYNSANRRLSIDRGKTANQSFNINFRRLNHFETTLPSARQYISLRIFVDQSIVEVFANNGEAVLTAQFFPETGDDGIELFSENGAATVKSLRIWRIKRAW